MVTVRSFLAVAAMYNWSFCQMDVSKAFLHGDLLEEVYMKLPMGYVEVGVQNLKPYKLPMDKNVKLSADVGTPLSDPDEYRSVQLLSHFMKNPTSVHFQAVKHLLRYILLAPKISILLANNLAVQLNAYCDSDWARCPMSRRSTTGYFILLGDSPISWKSKKQ
ncbi:secreted RxLR effector protein 161-like [Rutidosis leptorrhynchoides]|uniref:secreted RxLR effector protein 161-like n=1 Tax=Rutidosis leptorrhynchoides TaxID=125765 RepID=UPI003A9A3E43